jgi:iron complex outermembrane receptor protein
VDINAKGIISDLNAIDAGAAIGGAVNINPTLPIYSNNIPYGVDFEGIIKILTPTKTHIKRLDRTILWRL